MVFLKVLQSNLPALPTSETTQAWEARIGIESALTQPCQLQNAHIERYNRTMQNDWLAHLFDSPDEVQDFATRWLWTYNHERPNMSIGGITSRQKIALSALLLLLTHSTNREGAPCLRQHNGKPKFGFVH